MSFIDYGLLDRLDGKKHPLLYVADDFQEQIRSVPPEWIAEVMVAARTAHHLLDFVDIPQGAGPYEQYVSTRVLLAVNDIIELRWRLDRIATWHSRETGPGGMVGDNCVDCGATWPCDTWSVATGATDTTNEE